MALIARHGTGRTYIPELRADCLPCSARNYPVADFRTKRELQRAAGKRHSLVWRRASGLSFCVRSIDLRADSMLTLILKWILRVLLAVLFGVGVLLIYGILTLD